MITSISYDYSDDTSSLCDSIENEFGEGSCSICDPGSIKLYAITSTNPESTDEPMDVITTREGAGDSNGQRCQITILSIVILITISLFVAID